MGDVLDPRPPQWFKKGDDDDTRDDRVIALTTSIMRLFSEETDATVTQLAALVLSQRTMHTIVAHYHGQEVAADALRQANEIADQYEVK